jgi:hypothetical protein
LQLAEVVDALEVADRNLGRGGVGHHGRALARFEFFLRSMAICAAETRR